MRTISSRRMRTQTNSLRLEGLCLKSEPTDHVSAPHSGAMFIGSISYLFHFPNEQNGYAFCSFGLTKISVLTALPQKSSLVVAGLVSKTRRRRRIFIASHSFLSSASDLSKTFNVL